MKRAVVILAALMLVAASYRSQAAGSREATEAATQTSTTKVPKIAVVASDNDYPLGTIIMVDPDGKNAVTLANHKDEVVQYPVWSPDGKYLAYIAATIKATECLSGFGSSNWDVIVIGTDRSNEHKVSQHSSICDPSVVAWSPDSAQLVFSSARKDADGGIGIYKVNVDGSGEEKVNMDSLEAPTSAADILNWLPDGTHLALLGKQKGNADLQFLSFDMGGGAVASLSLAPDARWSADGQHVVAFDRSHLYVTDADGSNSKTVLDSSSKSIDISAAVISPDGAQIAFLGDSLGSAIYVVNTDGSSLQKLDLGDRSVDTLLGISWGSVPADLVPNGPPTPVTPTKRPTATKPPTRTPRPTVTPRPSRTPKPTNTPKS